MAEQYCSHVIFPIQTSSGDYNMVTQGIFTSLVNYGLTVFGNVWLRGDEPTRVRSFKKEDCRKIQVIQNKVLRLKANAPQNTSCQDLIKTTKDLSIHQLIAFHSLMLIHKINKSGKPKYLAKEMAMKKPTENVIFPHRQAYTIPLSGNLTTSRTGFCHRAARVFNKLPIDMRAVLRCNSPIQERCRRMV